jgi:hypothetical protein
MAFPEFTTPRGMPLIGSIPGTQMPGFAVAYDAQSTALDTALDDMEQAEKDNDYVATLAELPTGADAWPGRLILVGETGMWHGADETNTWFAIAGKKPDYFGSRSDSAIGTGGSPQAWVTTTTSARGITMEDGQLTFQLPGRYRIDSLVVWEANGNGQRNCGLLDDSDIEILDLQESVLFPNAFVEDTQAYAGHFEVLAPGAKATPYVTHNTGLGLDVYGTVAVMWVSA